MQYKIPVQIENEDPIILNLSLRQLVIIMAWVWIAYMVFSSLSKNMEQELAAIPAIIIWVIWFTIAVFKHSEMTFVPFVLAFIRYKINISNRKWIKWTDSFSPIDIGYIVQDKKIDKKIDFWDKFDKIKRIDKELEKI